MRFYKARTTMNILSLFRIALKAIGANKMRSFLTMLGIIIGVSSVIIMLALGTGSKATIMQEIADVDPGTFMIIPGPDYEEVGGNWLPEYNSRRRARRGSIVTGARPCGR